ncbi:hydroxymandelonitrile lyase [Ranunculus cassubicifolius]
MDCTTSLFRDTSLQPRDSPRDHRAQPSMHLCEGPQQESPAGVGFSYSNTTSDYTSPGDFGTAQDSFVFLLKWFQMFLMYKKNDFYIAGESYAGVFIPELATVILQHNHHAEASFTIRLKGIMIGNGFMTKLILEAYMTICGLMP